MQTIIRKSLLYRSGIGGYCLNHVLGCSHGCRFPCHAYRIKQRHGVVKDYEDWIHPKLVSNALELLEHEIGNKKRTITSVMMCLATDPFMYHQPEVTELSFKIIDRLNKAGIAVHLLTKGVYPKELAERGGTARKNRYGITLVSMDEHFHKQYEPGTAPYGERIDALRYLHDKGFETYIHMEPYPTPNIIEQDIQKILNAVSFADGIFLGRWNYHQEVARFKGRDAFYASVTATVERFCRKQNMAQRFGDDTEENREELEMKERCQFEQMMLDYQ